MFITIEGIDGTGKSTLSSGLARALRRDGLRVTLTAEPTTTWLGKVVRVASRRRVDPLADAFLFMADRAEHTAFIRKQLAEGRTVVCDRYADSTCAYQGAAIELRILDCGGPETPYWGVEGGGNPLGGLPIDKRRNPKSKIQNPKSPLQWLVEVHRLFALTPDITILITAPAKMCMERIGRRRAAGAKFEREGFLGRVQENYLRLARMEPERFVLLDGTLPAGELLARAVAAVRRKLKPA